jgi:beta-glucanase (GH16 family)
MKLSHILPAAIAAFISASPAVCAADAQAGSGETDGYRLVWQDLFDADELNYLRWNIEVNGGGGGNNELQYYTDREENVRLGKDDKGNGCLILTAIREKYKGRNFTSGRINSKNLITFKHGKVEAAIKLPKTANGLWPAFWMMGNDYDAVGWPKCGETDIMEFGHQDAFGPGTQERYFNGACHWGQGWPAASYAKSITLGYSLQDDEFHLYTCIWDENSIAMYVDLDRRPVQSPYYKIDIPHDDPGNEWSAGNYFHKENFILFNLAVGGNFPGIHNADGITALNDANGHRQSMYVNYVKIFQKDTPDESNFFMDPGDSQTSGIDELTAPESALSLDFYPGGVRCAGAAAIEVCDLSGRIVRRTGADSLGLEGLSAGVYIIRANAANGRAATRKISI